MPLTVSISWFRRENSVGVSSAVAVCFQSSNQASTIPPLDDVAILRWAKALRFTGASTAPVTADR